MKHTPLRRMLAACGALAIAAGAAGAAAAPRASLANALPQTGAPGLVRVIAQDAEGNALADVVALVPTFDANEAHARLFPVPVPQPLRKAVTLRLGNAWRGWLVVPSGWTLYHSRATGMPGSRTAAFVAAGGKARGWLIVVDDDTYQGDARFAGNGLFPDALAMVTPARAYQPRPPRTNVALVPAPVSIERPTDCTVKITYRAAGLTVAGAAVLWPYRHPGVGTHASYGGYLREVFVATPPGHAALQDFIVGAFLAQHDQRPGGCP